MSKNSKKENYITLVSGLDGVGKTELSNALVNELIKIGYPAVRPIKATTREKEKLEVTGLDCISMKEGKFIESVNNKDIIIPYEHGGYLYGYLNKLLTDLSGGKEIIAEAGIEGIIAVKDYVTKNNLPHRIIPILLHCDPKDALNRLIKRPGEVTLSGEDIQHEHSRYKSKKDVYRHLILNPDQKEMPKEEFILHLAKRAVDMINEEKDNGKNLNVAQLRERYATRVLERLFPQLNLDDIMTQANNNELAFNFSEKVLEEYGKTKTPNHSVRDLKKIANKPLKALKHHGIFSLYFTQNEKEKNTILDLIEMAVDFMPQYRYNKADLRKESPMSLTSSENQMNFYLSYSLFDPIELPYATSPLHTITIEALPNGRGIPPVSLLSDSASADIWKYREEIITSSSLGYKDHHK